MSDLEAIINHGNRYTSGQCDANWVECGDGFTVSVIAGYGTYSTPYWLDAARGTDPVDPFTHVEVGFPSAQPEPWDQWNEYAECDGAWDGVFAQVPVQLVRDLVATHGGCVRLREVRGDE